MRCGLMKISLGFFPHEVPKIFSQCILSPAVLHIRYKICYEIFLYAKKLQRDSLSVEGSMHIRIFRLLLAPNSFQLRRRRRFVSFLTKKYIILGDMNVGYASARSTQYSTESESCVGWKIFFIRRKTSRL